MISLTENKPLFYAITLALAGVLLFASGLGAEQMSFVSMDHDMQMIFYQMLLLDLFGSLALDRIAEFLFARSKMRKL
ncbi:hypothetical protein Ciccas_012714 [Cichlidogyrus casuarinus]|uniref:Uncharacterized protein n=1 Tax=Cichlidogyrus casuarinus TaxID=1844966 RepID=A0ABD2PN32_9PLAT